jgi:Nucleosome assembly protein (NAP)
LQFEFFFETYTSIETLNIEDFDVCSSINCTDCKLLAHLQSFKVARDVSDPKEVEFVFTFAPNAYLTDDSLVLEKSFSNVQSPDPASKITSTKVPIKWKAGKDLTRMVKGAPPSFFSWFAFEGKENGEDEFPNSADIAIALADEIYPHAHKIYQESNMEEIGEVDEDDDLEDSGTPKLNLC